MINKALAFLKKYFGYTSFRPGQDRIIESVLSGKNTIGIMPTGGGKSLCYEIPALCFDGLTIVISPLIALMKDQLDSLVRNGYPAAMINSTINIVEQKQIMESVARGQVKLLYLTPERFRSESFFRWIKDLKISLFAVDEAHCISEWGHDFRPEYKRLKSVCSELGNPPILALTATATKEVIKDIEISLGLSNPEIIVNGFNRSNLVYGVEIAVTNEDKIKKIDAFLSKVKMPGIIYTSATKDVDNIYNYLRTNTKYTCAPYHAKLDKNTRTTNQELFISGKVDILIATNAFGMGVNKPDIRFVIHYSMPGSIEAYYQETGRAGRDGKLSFCYLLSMSADERIQRFFIKNRNPSVEKLKFVFDKLNSYSKNGYITESPETLAANCDISINLVETILKHLHFMDILETEYVSEDKIIIYFHKKEYQSAQSEIFNELISFKKGNSAELGIRFICRRLDLTLKEFEGKIEELVKSKAVSVEWRREGRMMKLTGKKISEKELAHYRENLSKKEAIDNAKVEAIIQYTMLNGESCRRKYLLNYFGEEYTEGNCKLCDNCRGTNKNIPEKLSKEQNTILIFILLNNNRVGKTKAIKILKGAYDIEEKYKKFDEYGSLKKMDTSDIEGEIGLMQQYGYLAYNPGKFPLLIITERGRKMIK